jgi:hypothetical protein
VEAPRATIVWLARQVPESEVAAVSIEPARSASPPSEPRASEPPIAGTATRAERPRAEDRIVTPDSGAQGPPDARPLDRNIDLSEARRRAAAETLAERDAAKGYRSFTFPGTIAAQEAFDHAERLRRVERGLQQPLTAFDSPSKGRAGLGESTSLGQYLRWTSDDCYETGGRWNPSLPEYAQALLAIPFHDCVRRQPRADLFATLKPSYLMDEDERRSAQAASERFERLRRPTTGVVMPLP